LELTGHAVEDHVVGKTSLDPSREECKKKIRQDKCRLRSAGVCQENNNGQGKGKKIKTPAHGKRKHHCRVK